MVARITVMMIQASETRIIPNGNRLEVWTIKDNLPHALMVSCDKEHREDLENWLAMVKESVSV